MPNPIYSNTVFPGAGSHGGSGAVSIANDSWPNAAPTTPGAGIYKEDVYIPSSSTGPHSDVECWGGLCRTDADVNQIRGGTPAQILAQAMTGAFEYWERYHSSIASNVRRTFDGALDTSVERFKDLAADLDFYPVPSRIRKELPQVPLRWILGAPRSELAIEQLGDGCWRASQAFKLGTVTLTWHGRGFVADFQNHRAKLGVLEVRQPMVWPPADFKPGAPPVERLLALHPEWGTAKGTIDLSGGIKAVELEPGPAIPWGRVFVVPHPDGQQAHVVKLGFAEHWDPARMGRPLDEEAPLLGVKDGAQQKFEFGQLLYTPANGVMWFGSFGHRPQR